MRTKTLSPVQLMTLTTSTITGVDILIVANNMVSIAGNDSWISILLGGVLAIISGSLAYLLAALYPEKDLPQIIMHIGGKFLGRLLLIPLILYFSLYAGLSLRIFAQALKVFLLDRTPITAIIILMSLLSAYTVYHGIYTIGGVVDILFPLSNIVIIALIALSLTISDPSHLQPILFENTAQVIKGIIPGYQHFTGVCIIAYILCYTQNSKGRYKWYIIGILIAIFLYAALTVVCIMAFSAPGIKSLVYPTLTLSKSIQIPVTFLERLESITAILWVNIVYNSVTLFFYISFRNVTVFLGLKEKHRKYVLFGHIALFIAVSAFINIWRNSVVYLNLLKYMQTFNGLILLPILLVITFIIRKKEKSK